MNVLMTILSILIRAVLVVIGTVIVVAVVGFLLGLPVTSGGFWVPMGVWSPLIFLCLASVVWRWRRNTARDALLYLAHAVRCGLPLPATLDAATLDERGDRRHAVRRLRVLIGSGVPVALAAREAIPALSPREAGLLAVADRQGRLGEILEQLTFERREPEPPAERGLTWGYILVVLGTLITLLSGIMVFIMPKFQEIFADFDGELPRMTVALIQVMAFGDGLTFLVFLALGQFLLFLPLLILAAAFTVRGRWSLGWRWLVDPLVWLTPGFRQLARDRGLSDALRAVAMGVAAGLPLERAIRDALEVDMNRCLRRRIRRWHKAVAAGRSAAEAARSARLPGLVVGLLRTMERGGDAVRTLHFAADHYAQRRSGLADLLRKTAMPLVVLAMAVVVGMAVMALFMPIAAIINSTSESVAPGGLY